jgi:hypothetical protein
MFRPRGSSSGRTGDAALHLGQYPTLRRHQQLQAPIAYSTIRCNSAGAKRRVNWYDKGQRYVTRVGQGLPALHQAALEYRVPSYAPGEPDVPSSSNPT